MAHVRDAGRTRRTIPAGTGLAIGEERPVDVARLRTLRSELIDPTVASQNGRVFKRTGDGALVEIRSVVEAVRCAITVQKR